MALHDQKSLKAIDSSIAKTWLLGRRVVLCWCLEGGSLRLALLDNHKLPLLGPPSFDLLRGESRRVEGARFDRALRHLPVEAMEFALAPDIAADPRLARALKKIIRRYSLSHTDRRAVALLDIVGFSLLREVEQVTQLNSLAYSINIAERRCRQLRADIDIGRTTTGDGYYLWNRNDGAEADINLFMLLMLALADNTIAQRAAGSGAVPHLRACFTARSHFNFYQAEGHRISDARDYIVGEVTIVLARMIAGARPGQILFGDFDPSPAAAPGDAPAAPPPQAGWPRVVFFLDQAQLRLHDLRGIALSGERVSAIHAYLTGPPTSKGFGVRRYSVEDKHGKSYAVYNAKVNIHRGEKMPIYLGLRDVDLTGVAATTIPHP
jgi:hypothetical protein